MFLSLIQQIAKKSKKPVVILIDEYDKPIVDFLTETAQANSNKKQNSQKSFEVWAGYFQTIIYLCTAFMGLYVQAEITKHKGRLDLLAETENFLYLMEFKLDKPAENAIQQIKKREYIAAYKNSPKTIFLVGIGFSKKERNVDSWETEVWERDKAD